MFRGTLKRFCKRYLKVIMGSFGSFRYGESLIGILFVTPVVLYFLIFLLYPALGALYYSFTEWNMRTHPIWVGLWNYKHLLFDRIKYPYFWHSLGVTAKYTGIAMPLSFVTALVLALLINAVKRGQDFFKVAFYLPVITAGAAVATMWRWIYDPLYGLLNIGLKAVGLQPQRWLGEPRMIIPALAIISAWQCGFAMIVFLAGLASIPSRLYEAAEIDGAGAWQKFRYIMLPMLKPTTFFLLVTGLIAAFQVFDIVYVLFRTGGGTIGGPGQAGLTYVLSLFDHAFRYYEMGVACAMSFILFVIILIVTYLQFRFVPQSYE